MKIGKRRWGWITGLIIASVATMLAAPWVIFAAMLTYACTLQNTCL